jgi:fumarylacetoacetase
MVLMNDWSARDIQAWEYQPLGPVHSKNFGTTISPWVVLMDALEPFATHGIPSETKPLPYLDEKKRESHFDIDLKVNITTHEGKTTTVSEVSSKNLLFSFPQMLAHHTIGGCPFNVGDLLGSGTISGRAEDEKGCLLEMSGNGEKEIKLAGGEKRVYLADYDEVAFSGVCGSEPGAFVGFGECSGTLEPAAELKFA